MLRRRPRSQNLLPLERLPGLGHGRDHIPLAAHQIKLAGEVPCQSDDGNIPLVPRLDRVKRVQHPHFPLVSHDSIRLFFPVRVNLQVHLDSEILPFVLIVYEEDRQDIGGWRGAGSHRRKLRHGGDGRMPRVREEASGHVRRGKIFRKDRLIIERTAPGRISESRFSFPSP